MDKGQLLFACIIMMLAAMDLTRKKTRQAWKHVREIRLGAVAEGAGLAALTIVVMTLMQKVPVLGDSIIELFWPRQRDGGDLSFWTIVTRVGWMSAAFAGLMLINIPSIVWLEEKMFREGTRDWRHAVKRSAVFGIMHPLCMPIFPIGFAIMATAAGLWFTRAYFRDGLKSSIAVHMATNFWLTGFVITVWIINVVRG